MLTGELAQQIMTGLNLLFLIPAFVIVVAAVAAVVRMLELVWVERRERACRA